MKRLKSALIKFSIWLLSTLCRRKPDGIPVEGIANFARSGSAPPLKLMIPAFAGLGNFVMMTPVFRAIHACLPEATVHVIAGSPWGAELVLQGSDLAEKTWILSEKSTLWEQVKFFVRLRRERFDIAFIPFDASPAFVWWGTVVAGIPIRVGHTVDILKQDMGWARDVLTHPVPLRFDAHETDLHFDLLEQILKRPWQRNYETYVHVPQSSAALEQFGLRRHGYVVLQVSAADANPTPKRWPLERFVELAAMLHHAGLPIVLLGNKYDRLIVDEFVQKSAVPLIDLAGRTTIAEATTLILEAAALVCHDSGLMHIGNAVGTPLVALYGPTDLVFTKPMAATSHILRNSKLPCIGCMKDFSQTEVEALRRCPIQVECMSSISAQSVFDTVQRIKRTAD